MTASARAHWLDVVSDLLAHLTMADRERSAEGTALARILSLPIIQILAAQSEAAMAEALRAVDPEHEPDVAEALNLELQRRQIETLRAAPAPARVRRKAAGT